MCIRDSVVVVFQLPLHRRLPPSTTSVKQPGNVSSLNMCVLCVSCIYRLRDNFECSRPRFVFVSGRRNIAKYALSGTVKTQLYSGRNTDVDVRDFLLDNESDVQRRLNVAIGAHSSVKWFATLDVNFYRTTPDGDVQHTKGRFRTQPDVISNTTT